MLAFLVERYPQVGAAQWLDRMARGEVVNGDGEQLLPTSAYRRGMRIFYYRELERETPIPFQEQILFEDEHLVVVDKPHFLPMTPGGRFVQETLLTRLKKKLDCAELTPIHRLDRETAGVVIFSRRQASRGAYQTLFQRREIHKVYEALAPRLHGRDFPFTYRSRMVDGDKFFIMREEAGEPNSETIIDVIEERGDLNLYRLQPHTGRKHQLRVHLAVAGHPHRQRCVLSGGAAVQGRRHVAALAAAGAGDCLCRSLDGGTAPLRKPAQPVRSYARIV